MTDKVIKSENKVIINGVEYKLGKNLRTQTLYEKMAGTIEGKQETLTLIVYFYAVLKGMNRKEFTMEFDDFFDYLNDHMNVLQELIIWMKEYHLPMEYFENPSDEPKSTDDKKKD